MTATLSADVVIVGSGFAGSILARVLRAEGMAVVLVDRGKHPRFALGESTTPLANLVLERLAARYGFGDLHALAAWGRWRRSTPLVTVGLKRGFTFYRHPPGEPFRDEASRPARLLVAASPNAEVADSHWLREEVDAFLVARARAEGVVVLEETDLTSLEGRSGAWRLRGAQGGSAVEIEAGVVVDGSGAGGFLATRLGLGDDVASLRTKSALVYGHVRDLPWLSEVTGEPFAPGPYPDERAAVHHLVAAGWLYVLRFDDGRASVGLLVEGEGEDDLRATWQRTLSRHPSLGALFAGVSWVRPLAATARIQRRLDRAAGDGWFLLPHAYAFVDPLFSTGIAWSLLAVERLADVLTGRQGRADYARRLSAEVERIDALVSVAYATRHDFRAFAAVAFLYFAAVSWSEVRQRLLPAPADGRPWAWQGFLGVGDPVFDRAFSELESRVAAGPDALEAWAATTIASRDLGGFSDGRHGFLVPLDLDLLVERAGLLGLDRAEVVAALPSLRGIEPRSR